MVVLLSNLYALRKMANYPVASLQEGGLFWFNDLCLTDPYFALPVMSCATMYLIFHVSGRGLSSDETASLSLFYGYNFGRCSSVLGESGPKSYPEVYTVYESRSNIFVRAAHRSNQLPSSCFQVQYDMILQEACEQVSEVGAVSTFLAFFALPFLTKWQRLMFLVALVLRLRLG